MKKFLLLILLSYIVYSQGNNPIRNIFMQGNNINTVFRTDGIFNYDWVTFPTKEAGFIWPVSSQTRKTLGYPSGIWIGAKVGQQRELRMAACAYASHFTPGNIPIIGQVPPQSVCNDSTWRGYYVQLTDPSLVNGGTRIKTAGGRQYTFHYDSWASWPVQKGAPYAEINNIHGYQPGWNSDRPGIGNGSKARPDELLFMVYMDYTNCRDSIHRSEICLPGGTLPLGVEIHELAFMFNCQALINMYFVKYIFINKSMFNWDSVYLTLFNDVDIGAGSCGAADDDAGCDSLRNLAFIYNGDNNDCNYGINPPSIGTRLLQGPLKFTGNNDDTAKLPYDTLIGYKIVNMTSYIYYLGGVADSCFRPPDNAIFCYNFMRGKDGCGRNFINPITGLPTNFIFSGDACRRTGWIDIVSSDKSYIQSSGPFTITSGDTQIVVISFTVSSDGGNNFQNVCALQSMSDSALKYYYNDFQTCIPIGIHPISTEVPDRFILYQNYPNPFNPATKIKFNIPLLRGVDAEGRRGVLTKLIIYDILGREIVALVNEELKYGTYEVEWNGINYASGIYYYKLTAENFIETKKMVMIK